MTRRLGTVADGRSGALLWVEVRGPTVRFVADDAPGTLVLELTAVGLLHLQELLAAASVSLGGPEEPTS